VIIELFYASMGACSHCGDFAKRLGLTPAGEEARKPRGPRKAPHLQPRRGYAAASPNRKPRRGTPGFSEPDDRHGGIRCEVRGVKMRRNGELPSDHTQIGNVRRPSSAGKAHLAGQRTGNKPKRLLDRKSPIQVRIRLPPAGTLSRTPSTGCSSEIAEPKREAHRARG
jgi:hypothetical protein